MIGGIGGGAVFDAYGMSFVPSHQQIGPNLTRPSKGVLG